MDYDFIMRGDWAHRTSQFASLSPEEKADLLRTHRRRWLDANRHRLSAEQAASIKEQIAFVRPELYVSPKDPELIGKAKAPEEQALELFPKQDLYQLTLHGERVEVPRN
jgi:hypothetical protein